MADIFLSKFRKLTRAEADIITYMLDNTRYNVYVGNQKQLSDRFGVSRQTVNGALQKAASLDILCKLNNYEYLFNPKLVVSTTGSKHDALVEKYEIAKAGKTSIKALKAQAAKKYEEASKMLDAVSKLLDEAENLENKIEELQKQ